MRTCLYWNKKAGGGISLDELTAIVSKAGHVVVRAVDDASELPAQDDVECVVAAGGDGTVARAGRVLAGGTIPLAILPLGTANNIAGSLGIRGEPAVLAARWHEGQAAHIDVGVFQHDGRSEIFLESVGCGLVTSCIEIGSATLSKDDRDEHLDDARELYRRTLRELRPHPYDILLDGDRISGEFLLVEALNTPSIGPQLEFAAEANAADGYLSVVLLGESDRDQLAAYLGGSGPETGTAAGFPSWRARTIEIARARDWHIDDRPDNAEGPITISIRPRALAILA